MTTSNLGARTAIGPLKKGCEMFIATHGQFSLIDALMHLLRETGPAELVLCTWTAAHADLTTTARLLCNAEITRLRLIVDHNMMRRPNAVGLINQLSDLFTSDHVRTMRTHAKFAAIRNQNWHIALRTSMNLNQNPRMESLEISDDNELCAFLESVADQLFADQPPGMFSNQQPLFKDDAQHRPTIRMGKVSTVRTVRTGPR